MRKNKGQNRSLASTFSPSTKLTDVSGNPSESYDWGHMAVVRREWLYEFGHPYVNAFAPTIWEITDIEMKVRKELYP